jgi:hypothetical protein
VNNINRVPVYADDDKFEKNVNRITKNEEILLHARKEKSQHTIKSRNQTQQ